MMQLLLFLLTLYMALASACRFPLNDNRLSNRTLLREFMANKAADSDPGNQGWLTWARDDGPIKPWPWNKDTRSSVIPFCYEQDYDKTDLQKYFDAAWERWFVKIGPPSTVNNHHFGGFQEIQKDGQSVFCLNDHDEWDANVPADALVVKAAAGDHVTSSSSTMGYISKDLEDREGRHEMEIYIEYNESEEYNILDIAHEMGHVFGLDHEHSREDRDKYIYFNCANLDGYDDAKKEIESNPSKYPSLEYACAGKAPHGTFNPDWEAPYEFSKIREKEYGLDNWQKTSKDYDHDSIMQYPTWSWSVKQRKGGIEDGAIVRWKNGPPADGSKPNAQNAELIPDYTGISKGDIAGIQQMYP